MRQHHPTPWSKYTFLHKSIGYTRDGMQLFRYYELMQGEMRYLVLPNKRRKSTSLHITMAPEHQICHCFHKKGQIQEA